MLVEITGSPVDPKRFVGCPAEEDIFSFYDGPLIYTIPDGDGRLLMYWSDCDDDTDRWLAVPITEERAVALKTGQLPPFDALDQPECWMIDYHKGQSSEAKQINFQDYPRDALPEHGVCI